MRVMIVAPRRPWPPYSGDRARVLLWIDALRARGADVLLVGPFEAGGDVQVSTARWSWSALIRAVVRVPREGLPVHTLLASPYDWNRAIAAAGSVDCAIVVLSRTAPWVTSALPPVHRILDAIDSAAFGAAARAAAARNPLARWFWRREARAAAAWEIRTAADYGNVVVVSPEEASTFGRRVSTVSMGTDIQPLGDEPRIYDFGFWGQLQYFANQRALRVLIDTIWPEIRRRIPAASLFIGGARAPRWVRRLKGRDGIHVESPVEDRRLVLRRIRIALFPILHGSGQATKTLEAAEAGCAIVGTPLAFRALPELATAAVVEPQPERMAGHAVALLQNEERRRADGMALHEIAARAYPAELARTLLAQLAYGEGT